MLFGPSISLIIFIDSLQIFYCKKQSFPYTNGSHWVVLLCDTFLTMNKFHIWPPTLQILPLLCMTSKMWSVNLCASGFDSGFFIFIWGLRITLYVSFDCRI